MTFGSHEDMKTSVRPYKLNQLHGLCRQQVCTWIGLTEVTNIKASFTSNQTFPFSFQSCFCSPPSTPTQWRHIQCPRYVSDVNQLTHICQGLLKKGQMCRCPTVLSLFSCTVQILQNSPCSALGQLHDIVTCAGKIILKTVEPWIQGAM